MSLFAKHITPVAPPRPRVRRYTPTPTPAWAVAPGGALPPATVTRRSAKPKRATSLQPVTTRKPKAARPVQAVTAPHHTAVADTVNSSGGRAFSKSDVWALVSFVFCSLLTERRSKASNGAASPTATASILDKAKRLQTLIPASPGPLLYFAAQLAVFTRRVLGLRSVTHLMAAIICDRARGQSWVKDFVAAVIRRPDDAIETVAAYWSLYALGKPNRKSGKRGKTPPSPLPAAMKKGIATALSRFSGYQLAKYQGAPDAPIKLVDLFNLVHPRPAATNARDVALFLKGELKNTETWEARLSAAGSSKTAKERVWVEMLNDGTLGIFAILRNLANIAEQAPGALDNALARLQDPETIRKSGILPFQFIKAAQAVSERAVPRAKEIQHAIGLAIGTSALYIPRLPGRTLVVLDQSGSMGSKRAADSAFGIGAQLMAVLAKSQPASTTDFMLFSTRADYITLDNTTDVFQLVERIRSLSTNGATNFHEIFNTANKAYDNIVIISDQEGWTFGRKWNELAGAPTTARRNYERRFGVLPTITVFDLDGNGEGMFPEDSVSILAGFSDKVLALMAQLRKNPNALLDEVCAIRFDTINAAESAD